MSVDPLPVHLLYYSMCAAPGAAAGFLTGVASRLGRRGTTIATAIGAVGGMVGGFMVATVPTPPPGKGSDALFLGALALYTALCGWLLAFVASRALRRSGGGSRPQ